jgi:hypothetical protein
LKVALAFGKHERLRPAAIADTRRDRAPSLDIHGIGIGIGMALPTIMEEMNGSMERGKARSWVTSDDYPCLFFQCSAVKYIL